MRYGCCAGGLDFEAADRMIHFNDPQDGEETHVVPTPCDQPRGELSEEQLQAIMRALDEVLAQARSLRARIDETPVKRVSVNAAGDE